MKEFEYSGDKGYIISVAKIGKKMILDMLDAKYGNVSSLEDADDLMVLGNYEGPDNIEEAVFGGRDVDTSEGVFILELDDGKPLTEEKRLDGLNDSLLALGINPGYGDNIMDKAASYRVKCYQ